MRTSRVIPAAVLAILAACSDASTPTATLSNADELAAVTLSPDVTAAPGQAGLPGLLLDQQLYFPAPGAPTLNSAPAEGHRCTFSTSAQRFVCEPLVRDGLTFSRTFAFYDAAGVSQQKRDENTRSMNTAVTVKGTVTHERGTFTVDRASDVTVSGLGAGSTRHTITGAEASRIEGTRTTDQGKITTLQVSGDTTTDVVLPVPRATEWWPLSGTVVHATKVTFTPEGKATKTLARREVVTFNGTAEVPVVITRDGVTRSCTHNLRTHRTTCS